MTDRKKLEDYQGVPPLPEKIPPLPPSLSTADAFDFQLDYSEPTTATVDQWELVQAPKEWAWTLVTYRDMDTGVLVQLYSNGTFDMESGEAAMPASLIDRLQSLKALARKHFGEDWGKE